MIHQLEYSSQKNACDELTVTHLNHNLIIRYAVLQLGYDEICNTDTGTHQVQITLGNDVA